MSENIVSYAFRELEAAPTKPVDARELRAQAEAQGYAEGHAAGLQRAQAEMADAISALNTAAAGLETMRDELATAIEVDALDLAFNIAERIVGGALEVQPERVIDVVRGAVRRIAERHHITVIVSPEDLETFSGAIDDLRGELGGIENCNVHADRRVGRGGAIIRTSEGEIDVRIETQLQRVRELVESELASLEEQG